MLKQFCEELLKCSTHQDALSLLDFLQILIAILDENKRFELGLDASIEISTNSLFHNVKDVKFYAERSLKYFFNRKKSDWHLALNRFASILPSNKSKSDQLLFSNSFQTIGKMLDLQSKSYESNESNIPSKKHTEEEDDYDENDQFKNKQMVVASTNNFDKELNESCSSQLLDKWLCNMIHNSSSTLVLMFKQFLLNYEIDELRIK